MCVLSAGRPQTAHTFILVCAFRACPFSTREKLHCVCGCCIYACARLCGEVSHAFSGHVGPEKTVEASWHEIHYLCIFACTNIQVDFEYFGLFTKTIM